VSTRANYFALGSFVLIGAVLLIGAVIVLGAGKMFEEQELFETYINESVQGLDEGSAVKFRGVKVGTVEVIDFTRAVYERYEEPSEKKPYVRVIVALMPGIFDSWSGSVDEALAKEVARGLRVRLASVGLTGSAYLEMDYLNPEVNQPLEINWTPKNHYIPSAGGSFNRIVNAAEEVFIKIQNIDFESISENLNSLVAIAKDKLEQTEIKELVANVNKLATELQSTNQQIQQAIEDLQVKQVSSDAREALQSLRDLVHSPEVESVLGRLDQTLRRVDRLVMSNQGELTDTLSNLKAISENLRDLSQDAKRNPSRLLFGDPPPTR
jgi:ABC-type transporter Mla subunit MlaD